MAQLLFQLFQQQIEDRVGDSVAQKMGTFDYLVSRGGFLLLLAISKLTYRAVHADPAGLCSSCVHAASAVLDLPTSALMREKESMEADLLSMATLAPQSMHCADIGLMRPLPTRLEALFAPFSSDKKPTTDATGSSTKGVGAPGAIRPLDDSPLGLVCFHLLNVIENLHADDFALTELYSTKKLDGLLALLSRAPQDVDDGLITIHLKLTHVLSRIISTAMRSGPKWIPVLVASPLLPTLLEASTNSQQYYSFILQEICRSLISMLVDSTRFTYELMDVFRGCEGFVIMGKNLKNVGKVGTVAQQVELLKMMCLLLFPYDPQLATTPENVRRSLNPSNTPQSVATLPSSPQGMKCCLEMFQTLHSVLVSTKNYGLRSLLLETIMDTLLVGVVKQRELADTGLLNALLNPSWFELQSLQHRHRVLQIAKQIALSSGLHQSELTLYFKLFSTTTKISTALLLAAHLTHLVQIKAFPASKLTEVGFGICIFRFINYSPEQGRLADNTRSTPDSHCANLAELVRYELALCHSFFSGTLTDASAGASSASSSSPISLTEPVQIKPDATMRAALNDLTTQTMSALLAFANAYFFQNTIGIEPMLHSTELKQFMGLIKNPALTRPALVMLSSVALGDVLGQSPLIKEIMALLNHSELQSSATKHEDDVKRIEHLSLYVDVLGTLKFVVSENPALKDSFRNNGGFTWLLANIKIALSAWVPTTEKRPAPEDPDRAPRPAEPTESNPPIPSSHLFCVLTELITTLGWCLKGNAASKEGFAWGWYSLNDMLASSRRLYEQPSLAVGLAESFLSITTASGWPAACPRHHKSSTMNWSPNSDPATWATAVDMRLRQQKSTLTGALAEARANVAECIQCKESLCIELPEAFKLIIDHLGRYTEVTAGVTTETLATLEQPLSPDHSPVTTLKPQDETETAFVVILKSCKLLLDEHSANARILSSVGTCLHILTGLKALLLLENVASPSTLRQPLLLQLVERIASYSISLAEFLKFIELLRVPSCPINFLQTLTTIASRTLTSNFSPQAFLSIPKTRDALIRSPSTHNIFGDNKWPPRPGFTITMWFSVDSLMETSGGNRDFQSEQATDIQPVSDLIRLFSLEATQERKSACIEGLLTTKGHLHLRSSIDPDGIVFEGFQFLPQQWYQLCITQVRAPPTGGPKPLKSPSTIFVWVNAILVASGSWTLPDPIQSSNFSATFGSSSRPYYAISGGNAPVLSGTNSIASGTTAHTPLPMPPTCTSSWQLGNVIVFDTPIQTEAEVLGLYMLGPNYVGGFSGLSLKDLYIYDLLSAAAVSRLSPENTQLLLAPDKINLQQLHERIFFFLSSSEQLFACRADHMPKPSLKSRSGDLEAFPAEICHASSNSRATPLGSLISASGDTITLATRLSVGDVVQYAGGASTILYYLATAQHPEQQKLALRLIISITAWHAQNSKELRDLQGYLLIARVIRKIDWTIDEELLGIVFSIVGISRSLQRDSFSEGVIHNMDAFSALLLDWKVWKSAPNKIKLLLFRSLADIVSTSEHAAFNAWYMRQAGARTTLLLLLEDEQFPYQLAQYVITTIAYLMNDPWTPGDMNAVLRYMLATHPQDPSLQAATPGLQPTNVSPASHECPLGVAHKLAYFSGIQAHALPIRFEMPTQDESAFHADDDPNSTTGDLSDSQSDIVSGSRASSQVRFYPGDIAFTSDPSLGPVRDLILCLVLDMLLNAPTATVVTFFTEVCTKDVILTLLQTAPLSSRVTLLKILDVYLRTPALAAHFGKVDANSPKGCNGYRLLGEVLRRYEPHDQVLEVLFSMLFGKPVSYHTLKTSGVLREGKSETHIEHPEVATTILILLTSCTTSHAKKHTVLQLIYDIALHSDSATQAFLQAGLIDHLCALFVYELEHRIGRLSATFKPATDEANDKNASFDSFDGHIRLKPGAVPASSQSAPPPAINPAAEDFEAEYNPADYTIEQDLLRFLRSIIISRMEEGESALLHLKYILASIRALPLPFAYIAALQKQVSFDVLERLYSFDFTRPEMYERMQRICSFVIDLVIFLERSAPRSSNKTYQLSRYSSANLLARQNSRASVGGGVASPMTSASSSVSLSGAPSPRDNPASNPTSPTQGLSASQTLGRSRGTRRVSFWEILDSFESSGTDSPRDLDLIAKSPTKYAALHSQGPISPVNSPMAKSSSHVGLNKERNADPQNLAASLDSSLQVRSSECTTNDSQFDSAPSGSETDPLAGSPGSELPSSSLGNEGISIVTLVDLTAEEFSIVTRRAWSSGDFLIEDKQLVDLLFKVFEREVEFKKSTTSTFSKIRDALKHKMVGVTSLEDISANVSWHIERLIFHIIKDCPIVAPKLVESVLIKVATMTIPGAFLSETEFLSRFLKYSSRLLGGASASWVSSTKQPMSSNPELAAATLACWKGLLATTASRVTSRILTAATLKLIEEADGSNPIPPANIVWAESLKDRIARIENVDVILRRDWSKQHKAYVDEFVAIAASAPKVMREATRKVSDRYLKKVEGLLKPSLRMVERSMQAEKWIRKTWSEILSTVTHERAAWPIQRSLLRWELDPTEGPLRTRLRLMPVYAHRHPIIGGEGYVREKYSHDPKDVYLTTDLDARKVELLKNLENQLNEQESGPITSLEDESPVPSREHVLRYFSCSRITPFHKRDGELVIGTMNAYFIDSHQFKDAEEAKRKYTSVKKHSTWPYDEIKEIHKRRHLLINNALEIFLVNGRTYLLSFRSTKDRDTVYDMLIIDQKLPNFINYESEVFVSGKWTKMSITDKWRKGLITNFEYIMHLNTLTGRTYNDLTQYPVFPYILKDYTSHILSTTQSSTFREFDLPMGAQDPQRLTKFIEKYEALLDLREEKPYFYGSHYSNVGAVLHFLIRLEPYSQYFIEFQSGRFDVPDRVFHSVGQSWDLSSSQSQSDVKELIPEFFCLPEFLRNSNKFKFGTKQDGTKVDDVILPTWAHNSARQFVHLHMEALESEYVSFRLHQWINLIFGYQQLGEEAIVARNQFHPYTYEGWVDISKITDPIERDATITQINSYGQTPTQLFKTPHPKRSENYLRASNPDGIHVVPHKLQVFPALPWANVRKLHFHNGTPVALGPRQELLWPSGTQYLQWGNWDGSLRAINLKTKQVDFEAVFFTSYRDRLTCVDVSKNGRVIVAGSESGLIRIWQKTTQTHINNKKQNVSVSSTIASKMKSLPPISSLVVQESNLVTVTGPTPAVIQPGVGLATGSSALSSETPELSPLRSSDPVSPSPMLPHPGINSPAPNTPSSRLTPASSAASSGAATATPGYTPSAILSGHSVDVSCVKASSEQSIIVSGAKDGSVIVWDSNRLKFVRTLLRSQPANNPVTITHIEVMMYTSEIVVIEDHLVKGTSSIVLLSVNGDRIASRKCSDKIGALAVTHEKPGLVRNIIITGHANGEIKFWSAFDLSPIRTLERTQQTPVTALCVSDDFGCLFAGHASTGVVTCHATKPARFIS